MNCLPRCFCLACPLLPVPSSGRINRVRWPCKMTGVAENRRMRMVSLKAVSDTTSSSGLSDPEVKKEKSDEYSTNMTETMGADVYGQPTETRGFPDTRNAQDIVKSLTTDLSILTYRHELGMNYNFIRPDLIVGSCLQTPKDVDKLRDVGVKTILCLQQDPDLEYFGVDIKAIQEYAKLFDDIQHLRAEIRDFDGFDLRMRLPAVVSKLHKAINQNGGVTYVHCTAGLGRAPAVTLAYMFWIQGYKLSEAHKLLLSKRPCFPKLDAIKSATADILTGFKKKLISLTLEDDNFSAVEVSGLDIGWGQKSPLLLDEKRGLWILERELPEGTYEYKYVVDGEWTCNKNELVTTPNSDGHVNNYIKVVCNNPASARGALRKGLTSEDPDLTEDERLKIRQFLESYAESN